MKNKQKNKAWEVHQALHEIRVLFLEDGILAAAAKDTLTGKASKLTQDLGTFLFWDAGRPVSGLLSRPNVEELRAHGKTIFALVEQFAATHFPAFEHVNSFAAFDLEADLPWSHRKQLVLSLAVQENLPKEDVWYLRLSILFWGSAHVLVPFFVSTPSLLKLL